MNPVFPRNVKTFSRFYVARKNVGGILRRAGNGVSAAWKTPAAAYLLVFALAALVRVAYLAETADQPYFRMPLVDAGEYHALAKAWAAGERPLPKLAWQPWFYPLALAQLYAVAGPSIWAAKLLQTAVGALVCALAAALAFALTRRPAARWLAGGLAAFCGPLIHSDSELLAEPWAALWLIAAVLVTLRYRDQPRGELAFALGALGALLLFTRPPLVAAWLALLAVAAAARGLRPRRAAWADAALAAVGFAVAAGPFVRAIQIAAGETRWLPVTGGINFYVGNSARPCETINIRPGYAWENLTLWPELHGARTDAEKDAFYRQQAWQDVRANPGAALRHLGVKTRQFFSSREIPRNVDVYAFRGDSRLLRALVWKIGGFGFPFGALVGLAAIGLWARWRAASVPALALAAYAAAIVAVHVCARYRMPVVPLVVALAAAGALAWIDAARARRFGRVAALAAAALALGAAASAGGPFCAETLDYRAELARLIAVTAYEQRDFAVAEIYARRAVALDPREAQAWNQLGLLAVRRGDLAAAELHFRRAIAEDPAVFPAWFNLGKAAAKRGETADAIRHFREGLRLAPAWVPAWVELGDLLRAAGEPAEAQDCYREALRFRPDYAPARQRFGGAAPSAARNASATAAAAIP